MSVCLRAFNCPPCVMGAWKEWQITKCILLTLGTIMAAAGFYAATTMTFSENGPYIVCSLFVGVAGIAIILYAIMLYLLRGQTTIAAERENRTSQTSHWNGAQAHWNECFVLYADQLTSFPFYTAHDTQPSSSNLSISNTSRTNVEL